MRVRVGDKDSEVVGEIELHGSATAGELAVLLWPNDPPPDWLSVDGRLYRSTTPMAELGLVGGCRLGRGAHSAGRGLAPHDCADAWGAELRTVSGCGAGERRVLGPGCQEVPIDAETSIRVAVLPTGEAVITQSVAAAGVDASNAGVVAVVAELVDAAGRLLTVVAAADVAQQPRRHTRRVWNRPPLPAPPEVPLPPPPPQAPIPAPRRGRIGWTMILAPVLGGLVMAVVFHPILAVIAVLSPILVLGTWFEDRGRARRVDRRNRRAFDNELVRYEDALLVTRAAHRQALHFAIPDPAEVVSWARRASPRLWGHRGVDERPMALHVGTATQRWTPTRLAPVPASHDPTRHDSTRHDSLSAEVSEAIARVDTLEHSPVAVHVGPRRCVGISGDASVARAIARCLAVEAAIMQGPADLRIAILCSADRTADWEWARLLPHVSHPDGTGRQLLAANGVDVATVCEMVSELASSVVSDVAGAGAGAGACAGAGAGSGAASHGGTARGHDVLVVVDDATLLAGRGSPVRRLVDAAGVALIVLGDPDQLPASCSAQVLVRAASTGAITGEVIDAMSPGRSVHGVLLDQMPIDVATDAAALLAGFDDPEDALPGATLPSVVSLGEIIGESSAAAIVDRWTHTRSESADHARAVLGLDDCGPFVVDLVADGPHALVAGTTGSGKSELLRTLVVSLAARYDPEHVNFVLVDFKGGSAFNACKELPHVAGMVTDLDEHLAARVLVSLEAEVRRRERVLLGAGASDLAEYRRHGSATPLARLLIVVDEFAAMAADLPDVLSSLVDIARRGRGLGIHLILATQRPAGVVNDHVRANTNLRIALRVQDGADSTDVLGVPRAAAIGRHQPGRALARLGPGEVTTFQTALLGGCSDGVQQKSVVRIVPFAPSLRDEWPCVSASGEMVDVRPDVGQPTASLVDEIRAAAHEAGFAPVHRPWVDPLPTRLSSDDIDGIALVDEPERQRQRVLRWVPEMGPVLVCGARNSGTGHALRTMAELLCARTPPERLHLHALDFGDELHVLAELPHTGSVIVGRERERQIRLLRWLRDERERRSSEVDPGSCDFPAIVVLLSNYAGFAAAFDAPADLSWREELTRIAADGPAVGISVLITADRPGAVPMALAAALRNKILLRLVDPLDYALYGVTRAQIPPPQPGRGLLVDAVAVLGAMPVGGSASGGSAVDSSAGGGSVDEGTVVVGWMADGMADGMEDGMADGMVMRELQMATVGAHHGCAARRWPRPAEDHAPVQIRVLDAHIPLCRSGVRAQITTTDWLIPVGIADRTLGRCVLELRPREHVLVAGPGCSGRTTALATIACTVAAGVGDVTVTAIASTRSWLDRLPMQLRHVDADDGDGVRAALADVEQRLGPQLVLVDDVDELDDPSVSAAFAALFARKRPDLHVVGAGRADALRHRFNHWSTELRRSRKGIVLRPAVDHDGDLWQMRLPLRGPTRFPDGRGYLVVGAEAELFQLFVVDNSMDMKYYEKTLKGVLDEHQSVVQ